MLYRFVAEMFVLGLGVKGTERVLSKLFSTFIPDIFLDTICFYEDMFLVV